MSVLTDNVSYITVIYVQGESEIGAKNLTQDSCRQIKIFPQINFCSYKHTGCWSLREKNSFFPYPPIGWNDCFEIFCSAEPAK